MWVKHTAIGLKKESLGLLCFCRKINERVVVFNDNAFERVLRRMRLRRRLGVDDQDHLACRQLSREIARFDPEGDGAGGG